MPAPQSLRPSSKRFKCNTTDPHLEGLLESPLVETDDPRFAVLRSADVRNAVVSLFATEREQIKSDAIAILNDQRDTARKAARDLSRRMHLWRSDSALHDELCRIVGDLAAALSRASRLWSGEITGLWSAL